MALNKEAPVEIQSRSASVTMREAVLNLCLK
jgi:hypothetical protein